MIYIWGTGRGDEVLLHMVHGGFLWDFVEIQKRYTDVEMYIVHYIIIIQISKTNLQRFVQDFFLIGHDHCLCHFTVLSITHYKESTSREILPGKLTHFRLEWGNNRFQDSCRFSVIIKLCWYKLSKETQKYPMYFLWFSSYTLGPCIKTMQTAGEATY